MQKEEEESEQDALWRASGELIFEFPIDNLPEAISQLEQENIIELALLDSEELQETAHEISYISRI